MNGLVRHGPFIAAAVLALLLTGVAAAVVATFHAITRAVRLPKEQP